MPAVNNKVINDIKASISRTEFEKYIALLQFNEKISKPDLVVFNVKSELMAKFIQTKYAELIKKTYEKITNINPNILITSKTEISKIKQQNIEQKKPKSTFLIETYNFDNFVVGESNLQAYTCAKTVAQNPGKDYNPLFIYGPSGLGKTHLLQSIGNYCIAHNKSVICVTSVKFIEDFVYHLKNETLDKFKETYRNCDVLLIDDIQFLQNKLTIQQEFFHTYNDLKQKNGQIVMISDKAPQFLQGFEERLLSRFEGGKLIDIMPPELETKIGIMKQKLRENNLNLSREVIEYISANLGNNIRQLEGIIAEINFHQKILKINNIDMNLIKPIVKNRITQDKKEISIDDIVDCICTQLNVKKSDLKSKKRVKAIAQARQIAIFLSKELTKNSMPVIAMYFGLKDHSAVSKNIKKVTEIINQNSYEATKISELKNKIKKEKSENV